MRITLHKHASSAWHRYHHVIYPVSALLGILLFVGPPLVFTFFSAFQVPPESQLFISDSSWGITNFTNLYAEGALHKTLLDTAIFAGASTLLATIISIIFAWLVERTDLRFKNIVVVGIIIPILVPPVITTIGWILLLGERTGMINSLIRTVLPFLQSGPIDIFSMFGMILAQGLSLVPLLFIFFIAALRGFDNVLEEAAQASGANTRRILFSITLPLLRPHLLAGALIALIFSIEAFEVPLFLALGADANILASRVFFALNDATGNAPEYGTVSALGLHFLLITSILFYLYAQLVRKSYSYRMIPMRKSSLIRLGKWQLPAIAIITLFFFVTVLLPFAVLIWTSLHDHYIQPSFSSLNLISLDQYRNLLEDSRFLPALTNTMIVVTVAPTLAVFIAVITAWSTQRNLATAKLAKLLDLLASSSIAIPGVIAANGLLLFYLRLNSLLPLWVPLWGTLVVLIFAYTYRISIAYRIQKAGFAQLDTRLDEAAATSGAGLWATLRFITLPLLKSNWAGAWVLLSLYSLKELTLPLIIHSGGPPDLISTLIWKLWGYDTGQAAALAVISIFFTAVFLLGIWKLIWKKSR